MNEVDFATWASQQGLDPLTIELLAIVAASPEEAQAAYEAVELGPPIHPLGSIQREHDSDAYGVSPGRSGFLFVGSCPNGDPIALDIANDPGSVWYVDHESMHDKPLRAVAIRVASDLSQFINGLCDDDNFPIDYYAAKSGTT